MFCLNGRGREVGVNGTEVTQVELRGSGWMEDTRLWLPLYVVVVDFLFYEFLISNLPLFFSSTRSC
jgi:hypothetical protein